MSKQEGGHASVGVRLRKIALQYRMPAKEESSQRSRIAHSARKVPSHPSIPWLHVQALKLLWRQSHGGELTLNAMLLVNMVDVVNIVLHIVRHV